MSGHIKRQELSQELKDELENSTSIIITENPPSVSDRKEGTFYFVVTNQNEIPTVPNENIKVSPIIGIKKV